MPNYIEQAKEVVREELLRRDPNWDPDADVLVDHYTLLALTKGRATTLVDVHDAWSLWRTATRPDHHSLIPFGELTPRVQDYDRPYVEAIHAAADRLGVKVSADGGVGRFARVLYEAWRAQRISSGETVHVVKGSDALLGWDALTDEARADDIAIAGRAMASLAGWGLVLTPAAAVAA